VLQFTVRIQSPSGGLFRFTLGPPKGPAEIDARAHGTATETEHAFEQWSLPARTYELWVLPPTDGFWSFELREWG
jgi:hypothetical protein